MSHTTTLKQSVNIREYEQLNEALTEIARTLTEARLQVGKTSIRLTWRGGTINYTQRNGVYVATIDSDYRNECDPVHRNVERQYQHQCVRLQLKRMKYSVKQTDSKNEANKIFLHARRL